MRENILNLIDNYQIWGAVFVAFVVFVVLLKMQGQLKKLNRNFEFVISKMQEYFEVILKEDLEQEPQSKEERREDIYLTRQEREMLLSNNGKTVKPEDEVVFNAVLQEYFS
ncbi:hypothetical protein LQZ18_15460 [Lachnospiraceae bacterium ZAX-1]